jgi:hypothetical protein
MSPDIATVSRNIPSDGNLSPYLREIQRFRTFHQYRPPLPRSKDAPSEMLGVDIDCETLLERRIDQLRRDNHYRVFTSIERIAGTPSAKRYGPTWAVGISRSPMQRCSMSRTGGQSGSACNCRRIVRRTLNA